MAFTEDKLSPIRWIATVNPSTTEQRTYVKSPSKFDYELEDVSESDAGRTEDGFMHKMRIGQVNKLLMEWQNISTTDAKTLMQMFQPEYFYVNFLDPYSGTYHTEYMYRGNISASMYSNWNSGKTTGTGGGVWTLSFNLIKVNGGTMISA